MRAENDRHHALDAVVVACSTVAMQQKITRFVRYKEMNAFDGKTIDKETGEVLHQKTHFPQPWDFFAQEVMIRVFGKPDGKSEFEEADTPKTAYPARRKIIFSPRSRARIRYATVCFSRAQSEDERARPYGDRQIRQTTGRRHQRVARTADTIKTERLGKNGQREREHKLYEGLKARLKAHKDDPAKAFAEPFYKYDKAGNRTQQVKPYA